MRRPGGRRPPEAATLPVTFQPLKAYISTGEPMGWTVQVLRLMGQDCGREGMLPLWGGDLLVGTSPAIIFTVIFLIVSVIVVTGRSPPPIGRPVLVPHGQSGAGTPWAERCCCHERTETDQFTTETLRVKCLGFVAGALVIEGIICTFAQFHGGTACGRNGTYTKSTF